MAQRSTGLFLPTTEIIDTNKLNEPLTNELFKELMIRIVQAFNDSNSIVNKKDSGYYVREEFVNGQLFFPNPNLSSTTSTAPTFRQVFRRVYKVNTLPNAGTLTTAHGLAPTANYTFTRIYGTANDVGASLEYIPLPFVDVSGAATVGNVELRVDGTNIYITTTGNGTNFTENYVILEYIKQ